MQTIDKGLFEALESLGKTMEDPQWTEMLNRAVNNPDPQKTIDQAYDQKYGAYFMSLMVRFEKGDLFKAQRANFDNWLATSADDYNHDVEMYGEIECKRKFLNLKANEKLWFFFRERVIFPRLKSRLWILKKKVDGGRAYNDMFDSWAQVNVDKDWNWQTF